MTKRMAVLIVLAVVFAGLLFYVRSYEVGPTAKEKADETKLPVVLKLKPSSIARVELECADGKIVMRKKSDGLWGMSSPVRTRGDMIAMESITDSISYMRAKTKIDDKKIRLSDYGLDKPACRVEASDGRKTIAEIEVGGKSPFGDATYVKRAGDTAIYIVDEVNVAPFRKTVNELRDRSVIDNIRRSEIRAVSVTAGGRGSICEKRIGGGKESATEKGKKKKPLPEWHFGNRKTADCESAMDGLLSEVDFMQVAEFVDSPAADPAVYGLADPAYLLEIRFTKKAPLRLEFGANMNGGVYVRNDTRKEIYRIDPALIEKLETFRKESSKM